jgi:hypothetical protein
MKEDERREHIEGGRWESHAFDLVSCSTNLSNPLILFEKLHKLAAPRKEEIIGY